MPKLCEKLEESKYFMEAKEKKIMNKIFLFYSNMKKNISSIREERVESQFWMDLPLAFPDIT